MSEGMLRLEGVSKRFQRGAGHDTLVDLIASGVSRLLRRASESAGPRAKADESFWVLDDVTFDIRAGEAVGLIGPNGAGKSTALKMIAGIMRPERGRIETRGRLTALIEIGAGFHGDLTGRENIYMNGAILGMRKAEVDRKLDAIVDFSGVEAFIDTPVKRYSSGMQARLGFSVAAHVEPDILLVDEVLSVGDVLFRQRCIQRMRELVDGGAILLFVTHHLDQMQAFCSRGLVLDDGRLIFDGATAPAVARYIDALKHQEGLLAGCDKQRRARITSFSLRNARAEEVLLSHTDEPLEVDIEFELDEPIRNLMVEIDVQQEVGSLLLNFSSVRDDRLFDAPVGPGRVTLSLPSLPLAGGQYFWRALLRDIDAGEIIADTDYRFSSVVEDRGRTTGVLCLPHTWTHAKGNPGESDRAADFSPRGCPREPKSAARV